MMAVVGPTGSACVEKTCNTSKAIGIQRGSLGLSQILAPENPQQVLLVACGKKT